MTEKAYLFSFSDSFGTSETAKAVLNAIPEVAIWRYDMTNSFYIVSAASADFLTDEIRKRQEKGRFIVTEIPANSSGYLTQESWYLIRNLKRKPSAE